MFQVSAAEWAALRSQIVISRIERGGRRYAPYAFTEQGVAMLSSVLNSARAIAVNIEIMRTFVRMRELLASIKELARRFAQLETRLDKRLTAHHEAIAATLPGRLTFTAPLLLVPVGPKGYSTRHDVAGHYYLRAGQAWRSALRSPYAYCRGGCPRLARGWNVARSKSSVTIPNSPRWTSVRACPTRRIGSAVS